MKLYGACVGTHNVETMVKFYEKVFGYEPYIDGPDRRFFDAQLIIFDLDCLGDTGAQTANAGMVYSVGDVDLEFSRLKSLGIASDPPTNKSWGVRSFTVSDPDGNAVSFFRNL